MAEFLSTGLGTALLIVAQCLLMAIFLLLSAYFILYADRKIWAAVQMRRGPNVVGAFGLLQSLADMLKLVLKEIVVPAGADRTVYFLAPLLAFTLAMVSWAVIPFSENWVLADINVAILYVFAIGSLEVYGVIMGGWASNSKYPFLGSLRSAAQMISYEVSIGLIIIGVVLSTGSLNFGDIVRAQDGDLGLFNWYWLPHLPMVFLFFISALAETNRPPFDLPEAESELVAGYQVEYSSTPFLLFMAGEYIAIFLMCALITLLFFGGWLSPIPFLPDSPLWMVLKMGFFFFLFAMVKAIVPRYRYDQLMRLGWKVFLPFSLAWVVIVAFLAKFEVLGGFWARWAVGGVMRPFRYIVLATLIAPFAAEAGNSQSFDAAFAKFETSMTALTSNFLNDACEVELEALDIAHGAEFLQRQYLDPIFGELREVAEASGDQWRNIPVLSEPLEDVFDEAMIGTGLYVNASSVLVEDFIEFAGGFEISDESKPKKNVEELQSARIKLLASLELSNCLRSADKPAQTEASKKLRDDTLADIDNGLECSQFISYVERFLDFEFASLTPEEREETALRISVEQQAEYAESKREAANCDRSN